MNYLSIDYLIVYVFLIITLVLGLRAGRGIKDIREYALANKSFGTGALVLSLLATDIGGAFVIICTALALSDGIIIPIIHLGLIVNFSIMAFLVAPNMVHFRQCMTMGDIMKSLYGTYSAIITSLLGFLIIICLIGMELVMLGVISESILGIQASWGTIIGGFILATYSVRGGIKAVAVTDVFQFLVFVVGIPLLTYIVVDHAGGIQAIFTQVPAARLQVIGHEKFSYYLVLFIIWSFFPLGVSSPIVVQRMLMAQHPKQLRDQFLVVGVFLALFRWVLFFLGLAALVLYPTLEANHVVAHTIHELLPVGLKGLAMASMVGVSMSSLDSQLHTAGLTLVHDVIKPLCDKRNIAIHELRWVRWVTVLISIAVIGIGLTATDAWQLSLAALGFQAPTILFPMLAGIMGLKVDQRSFYTALLVTLASFIATKLYLPEAYSHFAILIHVLANGLTFFGMHLAQNKGFVFVQRTQEGIAEKYWKPRSKPFLERVKRYFPTPQNMLSYSQLSVQKYGAPYILFGVFCCINFTMPYFMWSHKLTQAYDLMIYLRLIGATMCALLIVKEKWSQQLLPYLPTFWHLTLLYCIPFTSTVMFLLTQGSTEWLINVTLTIMFLIVLVDWMSFFILTGLGIALGFLFYTQLVGPIDLKLDFTTGYLLVYQGIFATLIGLLFARRRQQKFDRAVIRRQQLATAHQATSGRLVEALNYQDNLARGLSKEGTHVLEDMYAASRELEEAIKRTPNKKLHKAIEKLESGIDYLKEISYRTKYYLRLEVSKVSLDTLLREVQLAIKTQDLEPTPSLAIQLITQQKELQGDVERIKTLLINGICYAQQYNIENHPIQLAVESTQLGYKLSSIKDYTKKIDALRFTITTDDTLPTLQPIYMGDISTAQVPPETLLDLPKTENARIVDAHYGVVAYYEMEENLSIVYVIPLRIRDIRPKNMDLKEMQKGPEEVIVDYAGAAALEHELLESIKDKAQGVSIAKVEKAIGIIKKYHGSQKRKSGEPFYFHPITVAQLVLDFDQDEDTIIAALLHDIVEDTSMSLVQVEAMFGPGVARLVDGVTKLDKGTRRLSLSSYENTKKLLDEEEKRILKIKLADRIHNIRTIQGHASYEKQKQISEETLQFFIPLARQLGLTQAVEELKSLVFDVLNRG